MALTSRPRRIGITQDGSIWYVDYSGGRLGRHDPKTGTVQEWLCPSGSSAAPYSMTVDDRNRIWLVETGPRPNRLVGFDPVSETFSTPLPIASGGLTVRHMVFDRKTRSIWFATDANTLVRAVLTDDGPVALRQPHARARLNPHDEMRMRWRPQPGLKSSVWVWAEGSFPNASTDISGRILGRISAHEP